MIRTIKCNKIIWHHIDKVDDETLLFLKNNFKFHLLDIKDVESGVEESKIDIYNKYAFLILQFPILHRESGQINYMELDIFIGADFLITIQKGKYKLMRDFYYKTQNNMSFRRSCFAKNPGYLLYRILERLYHNTKFINNYAGKKARELEDQVYSGEINENTAKQIAYLRRKILSLKRIFEPQREVFRILSQLKRKFFSSELDVYFDDLDDYVEKVCNFLDSYKYAMKDLLEVHDSLLTHKTNKVIQMLTVISVCILPLTLLSGIYGMNINLPFSHSPIIIWMMFFGLLVLILISVVILKKKKWL